MPLTGSNHEHVNAEINEDAHRTLFLLVDRVKQIKPPPNPKMIMMLLRYSVTFATLELARLLAFLS
jgi:hypothetical protein